MREIAPAIHPTIGIDEIATETAEHAVDAAAENVANEAVAVAANVADAVPPVIRDNTKDANPFKAEKIPTVPNLITAIAARPIFPINPRDSMLVDERVAFIIAMLMPAVRTHPTTLLHILAHWRFLINNIPLQAAVISGVSCAIGTSAEVTTPHHNERSPVAWNMVILKSSNCWLTRA